MSDNTTEGLRQRILTLALALRYERLMLEAGGSMVDATVVNRHTGGRCVGSGTTVDEALANLLSELMTQAEGKIAVLRTAMGQA